MEPRASVFDPGLQPERTALAWRRTALALTIGPLVAVRLMAPSLEGLSAVVGVAGAFGGLGVFFAARARDHRISEALAVRGDGRSVMPGAALLLLVAGTIAVGGLVATVLVLL